MYCRAPLPARQLLASACWLLCSAAGCPPLPRYAAALCAQFLGLFIRITLLDAKYYITFKLQHLHCAPLSQKSVCEVMLERKRGLTSCLCTVQRLYSAPQ